MAGGRFRRMRNGWRRWPSTTIRVDGHCDERGTAEYNLAFGERRATVVRNYLVSLGSASARIQVRSLGKEAPFCHEERRKLLVSRIDADTS